MLEVDYRDYLSIDNGKGLLLNRSDLEVISSYGFDVDRYSNMNELIFDIDNYINNTFEDLDDLEEVLVRLSDFNYYVNVKK